MMFDKKKKAAEPAAEEKEVQSDAEISAEELEADARLLSWVAKVGLCKSNGEARKTIQAGGLYIGDDKVTDIDFKITADMLQGEGLLIRKGKKSYHRFMAK